MFKERQLKQTILLLLLIALMYLLLQLLIVKAADTIVKNSPIRFSMIASGQIKTNILVLGNSRGVQLLRGEPKAEGYEIFNLAFDSLRRSDILTLGSEYFRRSNQANIVAIELTGLLADGARCQLKSFWNIIPELKANATEICKDDILYSKYFPLTAYNTQPFRRAASYLLADSGSDQMRKGAFKKSISDRICSDVPMTALNRFAKEARQVDIQEVMKDLNSFKSELKAISPSTRVVLILAPFVKTSQSISKVNAIIDATAPFENFGDYLDLAHLWPQGCAMFTDPIHLNVSGMKKVRHLLVKEGLIAGVEQ